MRLSNSKVLHQMISSLRTSIDTTEYEVAIRVDCLCSYYSVRPRLTSLMRVARFELPHLGEGPPDDVGISFLRYPPHCIVTCCLGRFLTKVSGASPYVISISFTKWKQPTQYSDVLYPHKSANASRADKCHDKDVDALVCKERLARTADDDVQ